MATAWTRGRMPLWPDAGSADSAIVFLFSPSCWCRWWFRQIDESAIVDIVSAIALPIFAASVAVRRRPITVPFLFPVFLMSVGSLVATINALSPSDAYLAMAQDLYLFAWFIMLVNLLRDGRDLTTFRVIWMWTANAVALYGIFVVMTQGHAHLLDLLRPRGARSISTFYDPNMCANYLVLSLWIVFGLGEEIGSLVRWGSIGLLLLGIVATKSNGGFTALSVGFGVLIGRLGRSRSPRRGWPLGLLGASLVLGALCGSRHGGGRGASWGRWRRASLGRSEHSSEGRFQIRG